MSNPENNWIVANCTPSEEPIDIAIVDNVDQWCRYNEWQDPAAIDVSIISICVSYDTKNFTRTVCTNSTVLDKLLKNQVNSWLNDFCSSSSSVFSSVSFCQYGQWAETVVDPSIVALCWDQDQLSFSKNVCCNMDLLEKMTQDPQNEWLLSVCRGNSSETANETKEVLELVCRYSEWTDPTGIDMTDIAVCSEFDTVNFTRAVCTNKTFLLQLIKNLDNTWLLQFCANHSSSGYTMNFNPQVICHYETWAVQIPDPTLVAVCWGYDQGNFVMLVCKNKLQLSTMSQDPTNNWVRSLCSSYNEITNHTDNNASYPQACIVRDIIRQLNWSCSIDYSAVCQQDSFQLKSLHHLIQCGMESFGLGVNSVLVEQVSSALRKAANNIVALLVTLEESKLVSLQVTENIRLSVLKSVMDYLKHEESFTNKRELLQCFGNLLMNLMQTGREVSDGNFFLIKGSGQVTGWLGALDPLLPETPLLSVRSRLTPLLSNLSTVSHRTWNTQQSVHAFLMLVECNALMPLDVLHRSLGMISQGVDCETLKRRFLSSSSSVISRILLFLHGLPAQLHSSLKKCITNESYNFSFSAGLLEEMGTQVAVELPVSIIKRFPADMMETFRRIIVNAPEYFLRLPSIKQSLLVDKVVQRLGMSDGMFTGEEFHSLGVMATFVVDEIFINISRFFFVENIERIRNYCFYKNKKDVLAMMLQEKATFGAVSNWTSETLDQVDRFIFFLPTTAMKQINKSLMTVERMERLFQSQRQWEKSTFGAICQQNRDMAEVDGMFENQQFMLQYSLGVLGIGVLPKLALVPSCSNVRATLPSAWAVDSLTSMAADHFSNCLEAIGQDPNFQPGELTLLLGKVKQIYGPASALTPKVIQQLGRIATQFTSNELQKLKLNDLAAITALGRIKTWTSRQLSVLYAAVLNSTKLTGSDLDASTLVALGYGICGIKASEIPAMNPVEFSKSVRWVGLLRLDCTEEQLGALAKLLTHNLAFGPVISWGSEVFIEIGGIAAGLEDFVLSSLAKEQIEGLTPLAISMIPPQKFSVVFSQDHMRMFSYEQGTALTSGQLKSLNSLQQTALSMVLTSWEDKPVDFRDADNFENLVPDVPVKKGVVLDKWEGEDEEEDVKDNWDDEEVEEKKEEKKTEVKVSEKKKLSEKIKEKEQKQREKQEELKKRLEEPEVPAEMTAEEQLEEKLRIRKMQEEADLELAKEAFGVTAVNNVTGIDDMIPSSKDDFTEFENLLKEKICRYEKSIHYSSFLESLFRDLCTSLEVEDLKRINNSLTVLFNEKQKQEKQNKAKKKKNKGVMPGGGLKAKLKDDLADYGGFEGGYVQDYEDFM
ncbi:UNVERIFIED_CONTAM: hypothetical protein FKN15_032858 [Acipenser sinensis]